ncbi:MAG: adenylyltransferase/cytidyltransferase family protein, partial [Bryobacteraceae bacterium]
MANFIEPGELAAWGREQRAMGQRIGFTCGAFDLLHAGHVDYLERARGLCDTLIVAVNSDASIRQYKSPLRPIQPQEQRLRVVG